jgi:hypothetical protein
LVTPHRRFLLGRVGVLVCSLATLLWPMLPAGSRQIELHPAVVENEEEFERVANRLQPGDELVLQGGVYSQSGRRAVTAKGTPEHNIIIRAAAGQSPLLTRPFVEGGGQNNIEFVDCEYVVIRGLRFQGGSSGVRFIRGHHVTFEDCEIYDTQNNALTMNSGDCQAFVLRRNHIHHTGLSQARPTEGEGMYIGCHDGSCRTTDSWIENNYIHHLRGTSDGGNDGIEIKFGSSGNVVRNNVIHDTNLGREYPGIFVYGGGPAINVVEGNAIWRAGEGIQVVSDALVQNNLIFDCVSTGITAAPHAAVPRLKNVTIVHNTIWNAPIGARIRWGSATNMIFANNAVFCAEALCAALDVTGVAEARLRNNFIYGRLRGITVDQSRVFAAGEPAATFLDPEHHDFWPRAGSVLLGRADSSLRAQRDFNGFPRGVPGDVGAYEAGERRLNPGWKIEPGFKH